MTVCAKTAVRAFEYVKNGYDAEAAWRKAICEFTASSHYRNKNCPRVAFCGLMSHDNKWNRTENAINARRALDVLRNNPDRKFTNRELWSIIGNASKSHDGQMDVVLALWDNKLIR